MRQERQERQVRRRPRGCERGRVASVARVVQGWPVAPPLELRRHRGIPLVLQRELKALGPRAALDRRQACAFAGAHCRLVLV